MASYLDNIPTFNEYVEQRPQDEMLKVGLFKQQAYNEGVQKIQNSIDNIIGLDIIQPEQRKYLESKLNALGGQLNSVAASDFSNFQLVICLLFEQTNLKHFILRTLLYIFIEGRYVI